MENVTNLANKEIFFKFINRLKELKYYVFYKNVYCPDYGIPQKRRRLVLLASLYGEISLLPATHNKETYQTVKEAIGGLPAIADGEKDEKDYLHFTSKLSAINLKRIKSSVPNGNWEDWSEDLKLECHKKNTGKPINLSMVECLGMNLLQQLQRNFIIMEQEDSDIQNKIGHLQ